MRTESVQHFADTSQPNHSASHLRLAVGIATRGRPFVLADTLTELAKQHTKPESIFVAYADPNDIADARQRFPHVRFVLSELGLTKQRNTILSALSSEDIVIFLDDDFYLHPDYLTITAQTFSDNPRVAVATGTLLGDGINGPGLSLKDAQKLLAAPQPVRSTRTITPAFNAYGCNMSFRARYIRDHQLRFDESLPLYGWYEDVDFSRQLSFYGDIVRINSAYGVHLGVKSGRQSGTRLGYSQVANPLYLAKKQSVSWSYAIASVLSRSFKNLLLSAAPEPFVDRRGRLRGNVTALCDLFYGTLSPSRILDF